MNDPREQNDRDRQFEQRRRRVEQDRLIDEERYRERVRISSFGRKVRQGIWYLVGALELLLALRFVLRLAGANPENTFANSIYNLSNPFVTPFSTLFVSPATSGTSTFSQNIFDINLLIAMFAYLLLGFLVAWLVKILFSR
jgi:YggT family protein